MTNTFTSKKERALDLVERICCGHTLTNGNVPAWHHLDRVSRLMEVVLGEAQEGSLDERQNITLAALGHDALEDTDVSRKTIEEYFGARGLFLIDQLTNICKDFHPDPSYVQQVTNAEEAVRLIKLADLYDNCTSVTHGLFALGTGWAEGCFLPVVRPMANAVLATEFEVYRIAAAKLKDMVRIAIIMLDEEIGRYKVPMKSISMQ